MKYLEVQFKGNRRVSFVNPRQFPVKLGDHVVVQAEKGEDLGRVVQITDVDRISDEEERERVRPLLRRAGPHDYQRRRRNLQREGRAEETARRLIEQHRLPMKLINVEYQLDGKKVTFFFTADGRVDFRELVKDLAAELRTRIDLRQIGARDEAKKFGGFGPCGQRQCCSGWLSRFEPVTTSMAKEQNLPLNPTKLSGNCGRLKCCLRYELAFYREELSKYPPLDKAVKTLQGLSVVEKIDIFNEEVLIRFENGEVESIGYERLRALLDFEPGENYCPAEQAPASAGSGGTECPATVAQPETDAAGAARSGRPKAETEPARDGEAAETAADPRKSPPESSPDAKKRRRGRRGGRRSRRTGEGGSPPRQGNAS